MYGTLKSGKTFLGVIRPYFVPFLNHLKLKIQHHWGDLYDHSMNSRTFDFLLNEVFIWASKIIQKTVTSMIRICQPSCNKVFVCLVHTRSGCRGKSVQLRLASSPNLGRLDIFLNAGSGGTQGITPKCTKLCWETQIWAKNKAQIMQWCNIQFVTVGDYI